MVLPENRSATPENRSATAENRSAMVENGSAMAENRSATLENGSAMAENDAAALITRVPTAVNGRSINPGVVGNSGNKPVTNPTHAPAKHGGFS
jgi:hypothetical protein